MQHYSSCILLRFTDDEFEEDVPCTIGKPLFRDKSYLVLIIHRMQGLTLS